ncbi:hypothetical protein [Rhodococcus sp. 14-1411-2a]|uniref:hypothetical protein n=2 Tax=unclassified Rhodococcus (in: high G+C Gram-positive bacteria) TaxID=192944 RepID=UPI001179C360|nr:hypothetical protein [Rhodococcus sp. 14-1411-2a]
MSMADDINSHRSSVERDRLEWEAKRAAARGTLKKHLEDQAEDFIASARRLKIKPTNGWVRPRWDLDLSVPNGEIFDDGYISSNGAKVRIYSNGTVVLCNHGGMPSSDPSYSSLTPPTAGQVRGALMSWLRAR